jgi:hypothetical protein
MTRTLTISDLICGECGAYYETPEEAYECETDDIAELRAELEADQTDDEWEALTEAENERNLLTGGEYSRFVF